MVSGMSSASNTTVATNGTDVSSSDTTSATNGSDMSSNKTAPSNDTSAGAQSSDVGTPISEPAPATPTNGSSASDGSPSDGSTFEVDVGSGGNGAARQSSLRDAVLLLGAAAVAAGLLMVAV